jgi:UDP-3-O-[3-hydroxymyristoyl] glucosamine N-acyltransferase
MRRKQVSFSAQDLADAIGGSIVGSPALSVTGVCSLDAPVVGHLSFIRTASKEHVRKTVEELPAMAVLVPKKLAPTEKVSCAATLIVVEDAYQGFIELLPRFLEDDQIESGIHPSAVIAPDAKVGRNVSIGAHCVIGPRVIIGDYSVLHPHVRIYSDAQLGSHAKLFSGVVIREECVLGARVTIHDNTIIGADGFGYIPDPKAGIRKVPQIGNVIIGDDVEIGANTCIDRGTIGATKIGPGTKIDNLVQIGHNTQVGSHCFICGGTGIAGSTTIGDGVVIGGACGIADHIEIVSGVRLGGRTGVTSSLKEPGDYLGFPATKAADWRRQQVALARLGRDRAAGRSRG